MEMQLTPPDFGATQPSEIDGSIDAKILGGFGWDA